MKQFLQLTTEYRPSVFLLLLGLSFTAPSFAQTAQSYRQRAIELARNKSWDQAIASYHKALDLEPNDSETHYNLALALRYKGDHSCVRRRSRKRVPVCAVNVGKP